MLISPGDEDCLVLRLGANGSIGEFGSGYFRATGYSIKVALVGDT